MLGLPVSGVVTPTLRALGIASRWHVVGPWVGVPARRRADRVLARLQERARSGDARPVRVVLLVREHQKWSGASLHRALERDPRFEPVVAASVLNAVAQDTAREVTGGTAHGTAQAGGAGTLAGVADNVAALAARGITAVPVHDGERFLPLEDLQPDVVVYDQPYGLPYVHRPQRVSRSALVCTVPYGLGFYLMAGSLQRVGNGMLPLAWRTFVAGGGVLEALGDVALGRMPGVRPVGDPKVDELRELIGGATGARGGEAIATGGRGGDAPAGARPPTVVWAPHHAVGRKVGGGSVGTLATFPWSAPAMLAIARARPDVRFVLKPHPMLRRELVASGVMGGSELDALLDAWRALPNTSEQDGGDYAALFLDSDVMVTDSGSFLVEYTLTGRPLLRLTGAPGTGPDPADADRFTPLGRELVATLPHASDSDALATQLDAMLGGEDPRREERLATTLVASLLGAGDAGAAIVRDLAAAIHDET